MAASNSRMKEVVGDELSPFLIGSGATGKRSQQAEGIDICQALGGCIELLDVREIDIFRRPEKGFQLRQDVVIEAEIGTGELVFQHPGLGEQSQGCLLGAIRRAHEEFAFSFEIHAGDVAVDLAGENDEPIV